MPQFGQPGERIGYEVYPHPSGAPPILLIHGFTASSASFANNLGPLRTRFTVVTVDLLGHGESEAPEDVAPYTPDRAVDRIVGLMDFLGAVNGTLVKDPRLVPPLSRRARLYRWACS